MQRMAKEARDRVQILRLAMNKYANDREYAPLHKELGKV